MLAAFLVGTGTEAISLHSKEAKNCRKIDIDIVLQLANVEP